MLKSENINELVTALAKAQGEISPAIKDSTNPHFKSKYADLTAIWNACRQPLSKYGLSVLQTMGQNEHGQIVLTTTLAHSSGQWISSVIPVITQKNDPQGIGSALTYFKRYSLAALVGISSDEDDDGEGAMNRNAKKPIETISQEQAEELVQILLACDPNYKDAVVNSIRKAPISAASLDKLPIEFYERIKTAALKKREQYQAQRVEKFEEMAVNHA